MKNVFQRFLTFLLALVLMVPMPSTAFAAETSKYQNSMDLQPVKLPEGKTTAEFIENPKQPDLYTLRSDFKVERDGKHVINYQPYVATVGAAATDEEKAKVKKTIKLPDFPGYDMPKKNSAPLDDFHINYDTVVNEAKSNPQPSGNDEYGKTYQKTQDFNYNAEKQTINVKHVFQDINDFDKYGNKPGETEETITQEEGSVGSKLKIQPLSADKIKGFVPETVSIEVIVPQNTNNFTVEYRYNRNHYDATFDTNGGTEVPSRTLYYGQIIPTLEKKDIPTKVGATFQGWKPSMDLTDAAGKTFKKGEVITDASGKAIENLKAQLTMPAENVKFTAVWKDDPTADYVVQFWTEKADYPKGASLLEKYDFVGTHVYKDKPTGTRPDLATEPVKGVEFPDLDQARLNKIGNNDRFYRNYFLYLNKFYKYNKDLTDTENADPNDSSLVKAVSSNGKTVYNIYYDRQVYDLYFTKSNDRPEGATFYPEIWRHGKKLGEPGNPYHFKARFNQLMTEWPDDAQETKGFSDGKQSFGWGPNFAVKQWQYRDTPPYRLSADEFLDMKDYEDRGGYTNDLDAGNGVTLPVNWKANPRTFTTLSFGIEQRGPDSQGNQPMPHHMDFWMDGFEPGETIIDYNLYRTKSDTSSTTYGHKYPVVQGFTKKRNVETSEKLTADEIDAKNDEREATTPFPNTKVTDAYGNKKTQGKMSFMSTFFNRADEWGDVADGSDEFGTNGYIKFEYSRNKYRLRFNYDPANLMDDSAYKSTNQTDVFYQKPLKDLDLDNPQTLIDLGLTDLVEKDDKGKDRITRPDGLGDQMVFKGWALDPAGQKLVWENTETMPAHILVLYAKWGEPDYKWKVTFDPNGGKLDPIAEEKITTARKTIREGDISDQKEVTYAKKGENEGDKQVFTLVQRQKLVQPEKPTRKGYTFMGWEVLRYKKDASGNYTKEVDTSYRDTYGVPELYSYGNDVVSPIYLKAIWVKNDMVDVQVYHHFLDNALTVDKTVTDNPAKATIGNQRAGKYVAAIASRQDANWVLATDEDLKNSTDAETKKLYDEYQNLADKLGNRATKGNTYFQTLLVEPKQILQDGKLVDNPKFKYNEFHFFYRPFRTRNYKVNYVDERAKAELEKATTNAEKKEIIKKYSILDQEAVTSLCRHYDARNYKPIKGWKLMSAPQQQLFYDVDEDTNAFKGINGTGSDEITFFYKDIRVIEVPKDDKTPEGYVRVTFKAGEGGSFGNDENGQPIKEIHYDVMKGLKSDLLPVPQELKEGDKPDKNKHYITPEAENNFLKWDEKPLLAEGTELKEKTYVFTAKFVPYVVEQKDPNKKPDVPKNYIRVIVKTTDKATDATKFDKIFWVNPGKEVTIPATNPKGKKEDAKGYTWQFDSWKDKANSKEYKTEIKDTFTDGVTIEAHYVVKIETLIAGAKTIDKKVVAKGTKITPEELVTNKYDSAHPENKDNLPDGTTFKFVGTVDTGTAGEITAKVEITYPNGDKVTKDVKIVVVDDVVEQKDPNKKPDVPKNYIQVIVKTTDKATDATAFDKTFWVNPDKEVTISVTNPEGKKPDGKDYTWQFDSWKNNTTSKEYKTEIKDTFTDGVTIEAHYVVKPKTLIAGAKTVGEKVVAKGTPITPEELVTNKYDSADPNNQDNLPDGTTFKFVGTVDTSTAGEITAKVEITYPNGDKVTKEVKIVVVEDVVEQKEPNKKPDVPENYIKVFVKTTDKATDATKFDKTFWVNPKKEVAIPVTNPEGKKEAGKDYIWQFDSWKNNTTSKEYRTEIKDTFTDGVTIEAHYVVEIAKIVEPLKTTQIDIPKGKTITNDELIAHITPQQGKKIASIEVVEEPDVNNVGNTSAKVIVTYTDGTTQGTQAEPVVIPVIVHEPILPVGKNGEKPEGALKNYVKVAFEAGEGGTVAGTLLYYVSPEVEVDMTEAAAKVTKTPDVGYHTNGEQWTNASDKTLKATFTDPLTTFVFQFDKSPDIVEKTDASPDKPEGYVTVTFTTDGNGKVAGADEKVYYVNPNAGIKLVTTNNGGEKTLAVPAATPNAHYVFSLWDPQIDTVNAIDKDLTYQACFKKKPKVTIIVDPNGGNWNGDGAVRTYVFDKGHMFYLDDAPVREGYTFQYYQGSMYQPGDAYQANQDHRFTAMWKPNPVVPPVNPAEDPNKPNVNTPGKENAGEKPQGMPNKDTVAPKTSDTGLFLRWQFALLTMAGAVWTWSRKRMNKQ